MRREGVGGGRREERVTVDVLLASAGTVPRAVMTGELQAPPEPLSTAEGGERAPEEVPGAVSWRVERVERRSEIMLVRLSHLYSPPPDQRKRRTSPPDWSLCSPDLTPLTLVQNSPQARPRLEHSHKPEFEMTRNMKMFYCSTVKLS